MINWLEYPFIKLLIPFVLGIGLSLYLEAGNFSYLLIIGWILGIILCILYFIRGNIRINYIYSIITFIAFFLLGYMWTLGKSELSNPNHFNQYLNGRIQPISGMISEMPGKKGKKVKFALQVESLKLAENSVSTIGNVLVYLPKDSISESLKYGDRIVVTGVIREIASPSNPQSFNYQRYLHYKNIHYQLFPKQSGWYPLGENKANRILKIAFQLRLRFIETLRKHLPNENQFAVGSALILGYKDEITEDIRDAYAGTGAMHVLAVSGLHVGLIFLILTIFLKIFPFYQTWWRVLRVFILLTGIWSFALITGASPSVLRASTMFSFVIIGMNLKQPSNIYNTLAGSAVLLLFYNPFLLMNVGFQMSYLAVIGIVYFQPKIARKWIIRNSIGNYLWKLVAISIAAQLMTLPLSLYYFHQFPCFFWLSGLIVVPAAGVILGLGIGIFIFDPIIPSVANLLGFLLDSLISIINWGIFLIHQLPYSVIRGIWISGFVAFLLYLIVFCLIGVLNTYRWKWVMIGNGLFAFIMIIFAFQGFQYTSQQKIIIYDIYQNSLIDIVDGRKCYALQNKDIPEKAVSFAAQNNRWEMGITELEMRCFSNDSLFLTNNLKVQNGYIQFVNQIFTVVDYSLNGNYPEQKISLDHILIRNKPYLEISDLLNYYDCDNIIFDSSNKSYQVEKWQQECEELGIDYWYTAEDGAFILDIGQNN